MTTSFTKLLITLARPSTSLHIAVLLVALIYTALDLSAQSLLYSRKIQREGHFFKPLYMVSSSIYSLLDESYRFSYADSKKKLLLNVCHLERGTITNALSEFNAAELRFKYDLNGNFIEKTQINEKGKLISAVRFRFKKNLLEEEVHLDRNRKAYSKTKYLYDSMRRLIETVYLDSKGQPKNTSLGYAVERRHYNDQGKLKQLILYDEKKGLSRQSTFTYDSLGNLKEQQNLSAEEKDIEVLRFSYDTHQRWVEKVVTDLSNTTFLKTVRVYDSNGNVIEERTLNEVGQLTDNAVEIAYSIFEFDNNIKVKEQRFNASGILRTKYQFNEFGDVTMRSQYASDGTHLESKKSRYDSIGNLIEEIYLKLDSKKVEVPFEIRTYDKGKLIKKTLFDKNGKPL